MPASGKGRVSVIVSDRRWHGSRRGVLPGVRTLVHRDIYFAIEGYIVGRNAQSYSGRIAGEAQETAVFTRLFSMRKRNKRGFSLCVMPAITRLFFRKELGGVELRHIDRAV